jgi:hypothetical protein
MFDHCCEFSLRGIVNEESSLGRVLCDPKHDYCEIRHTYMSHREDRSGRTRQVVGLSRQVKLRAKNDIDRMTTIKFSPFVAFACFAATAVNSASAETLPASHRWGIETELVQPLIPTVRIIQFRATRTLWGDASARGDLVVGAYLRPNIKHDVVKTISEYMAELGYRQYVWRGLHADAILAAGKAKGVNIVDGMTYDTPTLFGAVNAGYRLDFFTPDGLFPSNNSIGAYAIAQFGVLASLRPIGLDVNDIGPRNGKPDWFLQGNLLVGVSF